jgi:hypothetical protein
MGGASGKDTSLGEMGAVLGPGSVTAPGVQASSPPESLEFASYLPSSPVKPPLHRRASELQCINDQAFRAIVA